MQPSINLAMFSSRVLELGREFQGVVQWLETNTEPEIILQEMAVNQWGRQD